MCNLFLHHLHLHLASALDHENNLDRLVTGFQIVCVCGARLVGIGCYLCRASGSDKNNV